MKTMIVMTAAAALIATAASAQISGGTRRLGQRGRDVFRIGQHVGRRGVDGQLVGWRYVGDDVQRRLGQHGHRVGGDGQLDDKQHDVAPDSQQGQAPQHVDPGGDQRDDPAVIARAGPASRTGDRRGKRPGMGNQ